MTESTSIEPLGQRPETPGSARPTLSRTARWVIAAVCFGVAVIAGIGFAGSYAAVTKLAQAKNFGTFSYAFPIGIDAGILVFLATDLVLTWFRIRYPLIRPVAWGLTGATIAFNAATAWGDWVAVGMHATIPVLFVVAIESARHAVGRIADITADKHIESPPLIRWLLAPTSTFRIWRRMRLWQLTSYSEVIGRERQTRVYRAQLRGRYGRNWRRNADAAEVLALRLARFGTPIAEALSTAIEAPQMATSERHAIPSRGATEASSRAPQSAIESAPQGATNTTAGRHESVLQGATWSAATRHEGATESATQGATAITARRPRPATQSATKAPRKASKNDARGAARDAIRALYDSLGKRPLESEMVAELRRIKSPFDSRQFANKLRAEIETKEPHLAALGSDNVRPLTGTDN